MQAELHPSGFRSLDQAIRNRQCLLPGLFLRRREILSHAIGHLTGAIFQVRSQTLKRARIVRPVDNLLTLVGGTFQPMTEFQLETDQIQFPANAERNTAPVADEILFKFKAMTGLLRNGHDAGLRMVSIMTTVKQLRRDSSLIKEICPCASRCPSECCWAWRMAGSVQNRHRSRRSKEWS